MKLEKWASLAEVVSGVAIVASLIVLIVEVRDTADAIREQTITAQRGLDSEIRSKLAENRGGIADLIFGELDGMQLTGTEDARVFLFYLDALHNFEWQYRQVTLGRLDETDLTTGLWRVLLRSEVGRQAFETGKQGLDSAFVQFIEETFLNSP